MKNTAFKKWFRNISITRKLFFTVGIMTLFFTIVIIVFAIILNTLSSVRAYVSGDALWAKAEKNAIYQLHKYGHLKDEASYEKFVEYMKVPIGDKNARLEIEKENPDMNIVYQSALQGLNKKEDIKGMIKLYKRFHLRPFVKNTLVVWRRQDTGLSQLTFVGKQLHAEIQSKNPSPIVIYRLLKKAEAIDEELSILNLQFASNLNNGAIWLENMILKLLFVVAFIIVIGRVLLTVWLSRRIKRGLNEISESADKVAQGDYRSRIVTYSGDEIGELVVAFNKMTDNLEACFNELKEADEKIKNNERTLAEAQRITHIGSWEWDVEADKITWSDELYRIYGLNKDDFEATYDVFLECIHPDDRQYVDGVVKTAEQQKKGINYFHRVIRKSDGAVRIINGRGRAVVKNRKLIKYVGTAQDVTEKELSEEKIRTSRVALAEAQHLAHIGSWEWNVKKNIVSWSDELYKIYGLEPEEFDSTAEGFLDLVYPDDRPYVENLITDASKHKTQLDYFHRIKRKTDGKIRMLKCYGNAVIDEQNNLIKITGTAQDVTEAKQFEDRIRQLSLIASESKNGIVILDKNGKVEWVNDGFTKLTGYVLEDLYGTTADILRKGKDTGLKPGSATYETLMREKKPVIYEAENYTKDGRKYWAQTTLSPLLNEKGEIHKIIAIDSDITRLKKTERDLIRAKEKAEQSKKAKEQFLAKMSHEIRTPMNGIIGFAKLLEDSTLTPSQKEYLQAIEASGSNLLVIINDILDFSKLEAGKIVFEERKFNLANCVTNTLQLLKPKITTNVNLYEVIDERIAKELTGDEVRLSQVLINLVSNAIKFTEEGEIKVSVNLLNENDGMVELEFRVHDTGIGIPKKKQEVIFESFAQASSNTTRKYGGTGLGLTISKELIELQGGSIRVESELHKGSDFIFTLKYKKLIPSQDKDKLPLQEEKQIREKSLSSLKILVVEDNKLNQLLATKVLEQWNVFPDIASNGKIAIKKLKESAYDLVLMDIQMPEMDGYEATQYIRKNLSKELPIIAMTANAMVGEKEKCLKAGLNDCISKPFDQKELYAKILEYTRV